MDKINKINKQNFKADNKNESQKGQSYLLKEPIEDKLELSNKPEKKKSFNGWLIGGGAIAAVIGVIIAVKRHKAPDIGDITSKVGESFNSGSTQSGYSKGYNSSSDYINKYEQKQQRINEDFTDFKIELKSKISDLSIDDLKNEINKKIPNVTNIDSSSEIIEKYINSEKKFKYDENVLTTLYAFTKKQQSIISDPIEKIKNQQSGIYVLSKLYNQVLYNDIDETSLIMKKRGWLSEALNNEVENFIQDNFAGEIPNQVKNILKEQAKSLYYNNKPQEQFSRALNKTAEACLNNISQKYVVDGALTPDGKKLLDVAEKINDKAMTLNINMGTTDDYIKLDIGSVNQTIKNFKKGNFQSGRDEFWKSYFKRKWEKTDSESKNYSQNNKHTENNSNSNNKHTFSKEDIKTESLNIFKKYGEDLGDLSNLKAEALKKARYRLSMKYHPDRNRENVEETTRIMQEINAAFDELIS